jgi:hypothetical protein
VNSQSLFTNCGASKSIWFLTALPPLPLLPLPPMIKGLRAIFKVLCINSIHAVGMGIASAYSPFMVLARACGSFSTAPAITAFVAAPIVKEVKGYISKVLCTDSILCHGYEGSHLLIPNPWCWQEHVVSKRSSHYRHCRSPMLVFLQLGYGASFTNLIPNQICISYTLRYHAVLNSTW